MNPFVSTLPAAYSFFCFFCGDELCSFCGCEVCTLISFRGEYIEALIAITTVSASPYDTSFVEKPFPEGFVGGGEIGVVVNRFLEGDCIILPKRVIEGNV